MTDELMAKSIVEQDSKRCRVVGSKFVHLETKILEADCSIWLARLGRSLEPSRINPHARSLASPDRTVCLEVNSKGREKNCIITGAIIQRIAKTLSRKPEIDIDEGSFNVSNSGHKTSRGATI